MLRVRKSFALFSSLAILLGAGQSMAEPITNGLQVLYGFEDAGDIALNRISGLSGTPISVTKDEVIAMTGTGSGNFTVTDASLLLPTADVLSWAPGPGGTGRGEASQSWTFATWFKADGAPSGPRPNRAILSARQGYTIPVSPWDGPNAFMHIIPVGFNGYESWCYSSSGGHAVDITTNNVNDSQWHHLATVWTLDSIGFTCRVFVDGAFRDQGSWAGAWSAGIQSAILGMQPDDPGSDNADIEGWLDDVALWNRALPDSDIATIYQNGLNGVGIMDPTPPITYGLKLVYEFDNAGNVAVNSVSGLSGTPVSVTRDTGTVMTGTGSGNFTVYDANLLVPTADVLSWAPGPGGTGRGEAGQSWTFATWFKADGAPEAPVNRSIFAARQEYAIPLPWNGPNAFMLIIPRATDGYESWVFSPPTWSHSHTVAPGVINNGAWHHLATVWTLDSSGFRSRAFVDGAFQSQESWPGTWDTGIHSAILGMQPDDVNPGHADTEGWLDDLALWNRGLRDADIALIYQKGLEGIGVMDIVVVPAAASLMLLAAGLLGMLPCAWRKRR